MSDVLLQVNDLSIGIGGKKQIFYAVEHIGFHISRGEILGIVGESGCGKSITALSIQGLLPEGILVTNGQILFNGQDLLRLSRNDRRKINGKDITMIFQESMNSLNPLVKIGNQIGETLRIHEKLPEKERRKRVIYALKEAGFKEPEKVMDSYPHELSGGMRQRAMIAMAVISNPKLIIADEPTTALDVTIQAQVLELLKKINKEHGTSILFISHDLGVVGNLCDRVLVMYAGKILEEGSTVEILECPAHEYTKGLINSIPTRKQKGHPLKCIGGKVPSVTEKKAPCPFAPRCQVVRDTCYQVMPKPKKLSKTHIVYCHNV
ncbi:MAG: Oligopeptide/dipeptide ABC transporter, ATP-binding protein [Lachnoclostridium sp.]|jgi:peptide/nickel transport system ATP-binding protein